jgi:stage III sporulation protein AH
MKRARWFILGLTAIICIAVYVNWQQVHTNGDFLSTDNNQNNSDKVLGEAAFVKSETDDTYFENARYTRKKSRDEAIAVLKTVVENDKTDEESRKSASDNINEYAVISEKETIIENLIKSKGFSECVIFIGKDNASVVVKTSEQGLKPEEAAQIKDIVVGETSLSANVVKIIEIK